MATPLQEAGRVLSAANEAKVRAAIESLESVLAALGVLPDDGDNEPATEATRESVGSAPDQDAAAEYAAWNAWASAQGPIEGLPE